MEIYIFWSIQQISLKYHFSPSVVFCIDNRVMSKSYKISSELQQLATESSSFLNILSCSSGLSCECGRWPPAARVNCGEFHNLSIELHRSMEKYLYRVLQTLCRARECCQQAAAVLIVKNDTTRAEPRAGWSSR